MKRLWEKALNLCFWFILLNPKYWLKCVSHLFVKVEALIGKICKRIRIRYFKIYTRLKDTLKTLRHGKEPPMVEVKFENRNIESYSIQITINEFEIRNIPSYNYEEFALYNIRHAFSNKLDEIINLFSFERSDDFVSGAHVYRASLLVAKCRDHCGLIDLVNRSKL